MCFVDAFAKRESGSIISLLPMLCHVSNVYKIRPYGGHFTHITHHFRSYVPHTVNDYTVNDYLHITYYALFLTQWYVSLNIN